MDDDDIVIEDSLLRSAAAVDENLVLDVIDTLRKEGWSDYIRSPYEGDGQLAKLVKDGIVEYVLTVDSDILVYCPKVLMRMTHTGYCNLYDTSQLAQIRRRC